MPNEFSRLKVETKDHEEFKKLAKKADKTIIKFFKEIIAHYKGGKK